MKKLNILLAFLSFSVFSFSQDMETPVGWASLNGGTTGGTGGDTIRVSNYDELVAAIKVKGKRIIYITDTIILAGKREQIKNGDVTVTGNRNAVLWNGGLKLSGKNIIVQNLLIGGSYQNGHWDGKGNPEGDAISVYGKNIWIDHCDLTNSFDGLLDISSDADFITVSWTKFSKHNKVMLIGSNDEDTISRGHLNTTIHHCWFDGYSTFFDSTDRKEYRLQQRMPRVRFGKVHVYNNYYESAADYCIAARIESKVVVEDCYFRNLSDPIIMDDFGKGKNDPEMVAENNYFDNVKGDRTTGGKAFDPSKLYTYEPDDPEKIPEIVMNGAGKFNKPGNHAPVAKNDTVVFSEGTIEIRPLENDTDTDGDELRISSVSDHPDGKVIVYPGRIQFIPENKDMKGGTIEYRVIDYNGGSAKGIIYISLSL